MGNNESDKRRCSSHPTSWAIVFLFILGIVNIVFTAVVFILQRKIQNDVADLQEREVSANADSSLQEGGILPELVGGPRQTVKRSASSSAASQLAVNVGSLFVSAIKEMCKPEGAVCIAGSKGEAGEPGTDGLSGRDGLPGTTGRDGLTGSRGPPGRPGEKGMGVPGKQGPIGATGLKGDQGQKGETGIKGNTGIPGRLGDRGIQGEKGERGEKGDLGLPGYKGEKGMVGEKGVKGSLGSQGIKGEVGHIVLPSPCNSSNHQVLSDSWRKASLAGSGHRDREGHGFQPGWHAFHSSIGGSMPETCPRTSHCGTAAPGWLKGSHPTGIGQTSKETVCFHWNGNCCHWQVTVDVINCGGHHVYNLPNEPCDCWLGYCGDA